MSEHDKDELSRFFQKAVRNPDIEFNENDWKNMEALLDEESVRAAFRLQRWKRIIMASALLILLAVTGSLFVFNSSQTTGREGNQPDSTVKSTVANEQQSAVHPPMDSSSLRNEKLTGKTDTSSHTTQVDVRTQATPTVESTTASKQLSSRHQPTDLSTTRKEKVIGKTDLNPRKIKKDNRTQTTPIVESAKVNEQLSAAHQSTDLSTTRKEKLTGKTDLNPRSTKEDDRTQTTPVVESAEANEQLSAVHQSTDLSATRNEKMIGKADLNPRNTKEDDRTQSTPVVESTKANEQRSAVHQPMDLSTARKEKLTAKTETTSLQSTDDPHHLAEANRNDQYPLSQQSDSENENIREVEESQLKVVEKSNVQRHDSVERISREQSINTRADKHEPNAALQDLSVLPLESEKESATAGKNLPVSDTLAILKSDDTTTSSTEKTAADKADSLRSEDKPAPRSRWSAMVLVSPDFSSMGLRQFSAPGKALGVAVYYQLNSRFSITAGATSSDKRYKDSGKDFTPPEGYWKRRTNGIIPNEVLGTCSVLEIPVGVQYVINETKRNKIYASAHLATYIMLSEWYGYHFDVPNPGADDSWSSHEISYSQWSVVQVAAGYERQVSHHLAIGLSPYVKVPVKGIGSWAHVKLYSLGAAFTIRYTFKSKSGSLRREPKYTPD